MLRSARALSPYLSALIVLLLCGWWAITILTRTPNVPFTDEWVWGNLILAEKHHEPVLPLIWAVHNGHRNLIGSIVFLVIDSVAGWNVIVEDLVGLAAICIGLFAYRTFVFRTIAPVGRDIVFAFGSLLIAGSFAYENFLIGYNIDWQFCTAAAFLAIERLTAKMRYSVLIAAAAVVVASFSSGQGILLWIAGGVVLAVQGRWRTLTIWCAAAAACVLVYSADYHPVGQAALAAHDLRSAIEYLGVLLAVPFNNHLSLHALKYVGGVVIVASALTVVASVVMRIPRAQSPGWYGFLSYGILASMLTAFSRAGLGPEQALSSRYESLAAFVVIGSFGLAAQVAAQRPRPSISIGAAVIGLLVCLAALRASFWYASIVSVYEAKRWEEVTVLRHHQVSEYERTAAYSAAALKSLINDLVTVGVNPVP